MKKSSVVIIKSSPWKDYALYVDHPEYRAILNTIKNHPELDFVLTGLTKGHLSGYVINHNTVAWDIPAAKGIFGHFLYQLHLFKIYLQYRPCLIMPGGLTNVISALIFSLSFRSQVAPIFIGEFEYHGRKSLGYFLNIAQFKIMSLTLRISRVKMRNIFALSQFVSDNIVKLAPNLNGRITLISYPISSVFQPSKIRLSNRSEVPLILTIAGIESRKGLDVLLKAVSIIPKNIRPKVIIKGAVRDQNYMKQLGMLVKNLAIEEWITFDHRTIGYDTLCQYYQAATLFVFPTRDDSLGVVVLEALHSGLPVIATSVGGVPDMIQNGVNGVLIEPDNPRELARTITWLLNDSSTRAAFSKNSILSLKTRYYTRITLENAFEKSISTVIHD